MQIQQHLSDSGIPQMIYVESVRGCPYTCAMCKGRGTSPVKISKEILCRLEPYYQDINALAIHGYGEPLLADLDYFVSRAIKNDFVIHMNTTGFFMAKKKAELLLQSKLSIRFSIHAGTNVTYKKIMGQDFDLVLKNISYLVNRGEQLNRNNELSFSFIVMKENIDEIEKFLKVASDTGIKNVRFMRLLPTREIMKGITFKERDLYFNYFDQFNKHIINKYIGNLKTYSEIAKKLDINVDFGTMNNLLDRKKIYLDLVNKTTMKIFKKNILPIVPSRGKCMAPFLGQLVIFGNGQVNLCCGTTCIMGDITKSTLKEIWNSDKMNKLRDSFRRGIYPRECGYCRGFGIDNYPRNMFPSTDSGIAAPV